MTDNPISADIQAVSDNPELANTTPGAVSLPAGSTLGFYGASAAPRPAAPMSEPVTSSEALRAHVAERLRDLYDLAFAEPPKEASETEAVRECNKYLHALGEVRANMEANRNLYRDEVSRLDHWLERVNATLVREETWLLAMLRHLSQFVRYFGKTKSRDLPYGVIGTRKNPRRIRVDDPKAATEWAKEQGLPVVTEVVEVVAHKTLADVWKRTKEVPPGCTLVEETEEFYANPKTVG